MRALPRSGGFAALYIAVAYAAAIPYFLVWVRYPDVVDPTAKLLLLRDHVGSMYAMHLLVYEGVGIALIVLGVALYEPLRAGAPIFAPIAAVLGLMWAGLLLTSSMVFNYGMGVVLELHRSDPALAVWAWQVIESVAQGIGGAGGELLGGLWMLTLSAAAQQAHVFPRAVIRFGFVIAAAGLVSIVPMWRQAAVLFGVLQIVWFAWVGIVLLRGQRASIMLTDAHSLSS